MTLDDITPIAEISKVVRRHRQLAAQAEADLKAALPVLAKTLSHQSRQAARVAAILQSGWNGVLCDNLASLDTKVAKAVISMIATHALCGGNADSCLRPLLNQKEDHQS